jgi:hypothetical protein
MLSASHKYIDISFFDIPYMIDCFLIFISWFLGYTLVQYIKLKGSRLDKIVSFKRASFIIWIAFLILLILLILNAFSKGTVFFSGYSNYDITVLGPFATMIFISVWFVNYFDSKKAKYLFLGLYFISSISMLGLGSRMFFVLGTISLLILFISTRKRLLRNPLLYIILIFLLSFIVWIGIWRSEATLSSEMFISIFLAEPLFTSTSGALYLENVGGRPMVSFPNDIFASFINFIPSVVFPEKIAILRELTFDSDKYSPFGANSIIVNMYSNFGFFYPMYFFSIGAFYGYLKNKAKYSNFFRATYFSILPLLMFHFFRESFTTVIKVMFFNSLILPFIIVMILSIIFVNKKIKVDNE